MIYKRTWIIIPLSDRAHRHIRFAAAALTLYDPGGGGEGFKTPPVIFCPHAFNFEATLLCVGDFSPKNSLTPCGEKKILIGGHDLAVRGVSKCKGDMIFIIFREFNPMLEIVTS